MSRTSSFHAIRGCAPCTDLAGLISIPFIWSDDKHLELRRPLTGDALVEEIARRNLETALMRDVADLVLETG